MKKAHVVLSSPKDVFPGVNYEHASRAGDLIFLAGQIAQDENGNWGAPDDPYKQAQQIYRNIDRVLAHVGATRRDVVKVNTILIDGNDREAVTRARLEYFGDHRPPHTGVIVAALSWPEIRIEVEVIAYAPIEKSENKG